MRDERKPRKARLATPPAFRRVQHKQLLITPGKLQKGLVALQRD